MITIGPLSRAFFLLFFISFQMTSTNLQIVSITKADGDTRKLVQRPAIKPVQVVTPIASKFAVKMSELLQTSNRQKRDRMVEQLIKAGVTNIDGWSLTELAIGRIDKNTGNRVLPNGKIARVVVSSGSSDGRYYGSGTQAPVTSLYQVGACWSAGS